MSRRTHKKPTTKRDIVRQLMAECSLSFMDAVKVHDCMVRMIERSVQNMDKLRLGHVGAIVPRIVKGKSVSMNFSRTRSGVEKVQRYFFLDERVRFDLRLYPSFVSKVKFNPSP